MFRIILTLLIMFRSLATVVAQVEFKAAEQYKVVYRGDTVKIYADTAFIINKDLAGYFNKNVLDLHDLKQKYNALIGENKALGKELEKALKLVDKLLKENTAGNQEITTALYAKINELNAVIRSIEAVNKQLSGTNKSFEAEINNLKKLNQDLKRLTRGIWWNGVADKLVAFGGGLLIGGAVIFLVGK